LTVAVFRVFRISQAEANGHATNQIQKLRGCLTRRSPSILPV
jgi:hypothetical protein